MNAGMHPAMRRQLMEAVGRKLDLLLNSQTPDTLSTYAKQIAELRDQQEKSREQLLERVAYTWFNRLCALRYLDAKGWHPFGCNVLMPADSSETQPELLKLMRSGSLPADLKSFTNEQRLNQLLDGQIPTAIPGGDAQGEVYRELVLAAQALATRAERGELDPSSIDENTLAAELFTAGEQDPDLLIRTSGERRISNFLLWQLAYAEIHVTDVFWPDFNREALLEALLDYQGRSRRFGGLDDLRAGALGS